MKKFLTGALALATALCFAAIPALASAVPTTVPEPASMGLLASGIAGIALLRQARKR